MEEKRISVTLSERGFICSEVKQLTNRLSNVRIEVDEIYFELHDLLDKIKSEGEEILKGCIKRSKKPLWDGESEDGYPELVMNSKTTDEIEEIRHAIRTLDEKIVSLNKRVDNCRKYMPEVGEDVE